MTTRRARALQNALGMKWIFALVLAVVANACAGDAGKKPDLSGPYSCGQQTCGSGQICVTYESGSQCDVNADAGIGPYQIEAQECIDLPTACHGVPSCDCVTYRGECFGVTSQGREMSFGCI